MQTPSIRYSAILIALSLAIIFTPMLITYAFTYAIYFHVIYIIAGSYIAMIYTAEIFVKKNKRSFEKKEITLITRTGFVFHAIVSVFLLWYTQQYFFNWFVIALYLFVYFFVTQTGLYGYGKMFLNKK